MLLAYMSPMNYDQTVICVTCKTVFYILIF